MFLFSIKCTIHIYSQVQVFVVKRCNTFIPDSLVVNVIPFAEVPNVAQGWLLNDVEHRSEGQDTVPPQMCCFFYSIQSGEVVILGL